MTEEQPSMSIGLELSQSPRSYLKRYRQVWLLLPVPPAQDETLFVWSGSSLPSKWPNLYGFRNIVPVTSLSIISIVHIVSGLSDSSMFRIRLPDIWMHNYNRLSPLENLLLFCLLTSNPQATRLTSNLNISLARCLNACSFARTASSFQPSTTKTVIFSA